MPGLLRRALGALGNGLKPRLREFLRARAHFHAALPSGPLIAQRYVVFDLEATGLDVSGGDRVISIGAVRIRDGQVQDRFLTLVNPARPIPVGSMRYHGISDAMVAAAGDPIKKKIARGATEKLLKTAEKKASAARAEGYKLADKTEAEGNAKADKIEKEANEKATQIEEAAHLEAEKLSKKTTTALGK